MSTLRSVIDRARTWPVESQQVSRRNAMIACTALAARRAEREDVDDFFATLFLGPATRRDAAHG